MIRHRPHGRGHPYLLEADQRVPAEPLAGESVELRATTPLDVDEVTVDLADGVVLRAERRGPAVGDPDPDYGVLEPAAGSDSHLAGAAQAVGRQRGRLSWSVTVDAPVEGPLRYRFVAARNGRSRATRWFETVPARWEPTGGELRVVGADGLCYRNTSPHQRVVPGSVSWLRAGERLLRGRFALRLEPGERVVGFGERFDALDQRGRRLDATVFEQYKSQGSRTYLPIPFAIVAGGEGWGFHVATTRRVWFDVGAADPDLLWIETEVAPEPEAALELQLYAGEPAAVLEAFFAATAAPVLPPDWVFEPWMSGNEWNTQERVLAEVERGEREGIPAGVLVIEAWSDESTFVAFRDARYEPHPDGRPHRLDDFDFPADGAWPDPKGMVDQLHRRGLRVLLWQIPLAKPPSGPGQARHDHETMVERGYAVRDGAGRPYRNRGWWFPRALLPDFTNREARRWWLEKRRYLVEELGIDGFKTDGGEHAWGHDLRYADGTRGDETNNRYPVLYAEAYHELLRSTGREGVTFSRAGHTGAAAVPCHWAGDEDSTWEAFRASIRAGLTAGASGIFFWGWDLGGFSGDVPTAELYLRSAAAACFSPIMQYHSEFNHHRTPSHDRTPWNIAERTGDARVIPIYRRYARLRQRLVPYLAEQARASVRSSKPLMRALLFESPRDERIWEHPFQYLLGDDLLVAPVVEPGVERWRTYLPAGEWADGWTGEAYDGGAVVERPVPLEEIPVYVRAGRADLLHALAHDG